MRVRSIRSRGERENGNASNEINEPVVNLPKAALTEAEAARYIGMSSGWLKMSRHATVPHRHRRTADCASGSQARCVSSRRSRRLAGTSS